MSKTSGMKVKLFIKEAGTGKLLAGQKSASLSRSADSMDATSKDTEGFWKESIQGFKEFSIDCDGAYVESDEAYNLLEASFINSENVDVYLQFPSGRKYEGSCTITDLSLDAPFDDLVTYTISLQGSGALSIVEGIE